MSSAASANFRMFDGWTDAGCATGSGSPALRAAKPTLDEIVREPIIRLLMASDAVTEKDILDVAQMVRDRRRFPRSPAPHPHAGACAPYPLANAETEIFGVTAPPRLMP
ncbi:hypothetical protein [Thermohalobaculum xanthum]|uniref:hypothetical protein n=1 Tax=Thermohalobaculum xanthum TaxID=2753746 RepID=UPI00190B81F2|nr:hypothetical protein [Thermohalobaculum xanthum]